MNKEEIKKEITVIYKDFETNKIKKSNNLADIFNNQICCKVCNGDYGNGYCDKHSSSGVAYINKKL